MLFRLFVFVILSLFFYFILRILWNVTHSLSKSSPLASLHLVSRSILLLLLCRSLTKGAMLILRAYLLFPSWWFSHFSSFSLALSFVLSLPAGHSVLAACILLSGCIFCMLFCDPLLPFFEELVGILSVSAGSLFTVALQIYFSLQHISTLLSRSGDATFRNFVYKNELNDLVLRPEWT